MKLSFIVPIYNVKDYLKKCVLSLLDQDYPAEQYEIILVDDGSTDGSGEIADQLAQECTIHGSQCTVIHQENGGLSAARNTGIRAAKGEYVCFVDSDDYWQPNVLSALMKQVEEQQLDVLRFDYQNVRETALTDSTDSTEKKYEVFEPNKTPHQADQSTEVVTGIEYLNTRMAYHCYAVQWIVRRALIASHIDFDVNADNCLFTEGIHYEDIDWTPRMLLRAARVSATSRVVYCYLLREGSITRVQQNSAKLRRNLDDRMQVLGTITKLYAEYPSCSWLYRMQSFMACGIVQTVTLAFYAERKEWLRALRQMRVFPLCIADQSKTYARRAKLINISPRLYCGIIKFCKLFEK